MRKQIEQFKPVCGMEYVIYLTTSQGFGVRSFCYELADYINASGGVAKVSCQSIFNIALSVIKDGLDGRVSILSARSGPLCILNRSSIFILHGFPTFFDYGGFGFYNIWIFSFISSKFASSVIANSSLTYHLNARLLNVTADYFWNPSLCLLPSARAEYKPHSEGAAKGILYVGRIIKGKGLDIALDAFLKTDSMSDWTFYAIGPILDNHYFKDYLGNPRIIFTGELPQEQIISYYKRCLTFISLNPLEPYGMVFRDSYFYSLSIILPRFSGFLDHPTRSKRLYLLDYVTVDEVANAMRRMDSDLNRKTDFMP